MVVKISKSDTKIFVVFKEPFATPVTLSTLDKVILVVPTPEISANVGSEEVSKSENLTSFPTFEFDINLGFTLVTVLTPPE